MVLLSLGLVYAGIGVIEATDDPRAGQLAGAPLHYAANGPYAAAPEGVGFNLWDVGPYVDAIQELPTGKKALVWIGDGFSDCAPKTVPDEDFYPLVDALATNQKVWGWFIWDEPDAVGCPGLVTTITERAAYIEQKGGGNQKTFIVGGGGYGEPLDARLAPARTGVDLFGIATFPCQWASTSTCDLDMITSAVTGTLANGFPREVLVPAFQAFGRGPGSAADQARMPTPTQMGQIYARWDSLLPSPVFDYTYSWAIQPEWMETALSTDTALQSVYRQRFLGTPVNCGTVNLNFTSYSTIREGSAGPLVAAAQCLLEAQGFELGTPNSSFGPSTTAAVRSYQQSKALPVDGAVNSRTWTALLSAGTTPTLQNGSTGGAVRRLQRVLTAALNRTINIDGIFGAQVSQAVTDYQRSRGLTADGICGSRTWAALQAGR